jgi:hypothetical protein
VAEAEPGSVHCDVSLFTAQLTDALAQPYAAARVPSGNAG